MSARAWDLFAAIMFAANLAIAFSDNPYAPVNAAVAGAMLWVHVRRMGE